MLAAFVGGLLWLTPARDLGACSCVESLEPLRPEMFRNLGSSIFLAQVVGVHGPYMRRDGEGVRFENDRWFEMRRLQVWKGDTGGRVFVRTGSGSGDCGYAFALGGLYLVYAGAGKDTVGTGICMRTRPWTSAHEDSVALGNAEFDRTSGAPWRALAPPISCPVHRDSPVRIDHSVVVYGMPDKALRRYEERVPDDFPFAGIQFEFARSDSARTDFTDAYICPQCRSIAKAWCRKQHVFLIADGERAWKLPLPKPAN